MTGLSNLMTVRMPPALTSEELTSLVNLAIAAPAPKIPAIHLARLVLAGCVLMAPDGPLVTGDGLIRITENG
jgi:hypothetical protein